MGKNLKTKSEIIRIAGKLKEVVTVHDTKGKILHKVINPLMVEVYPRDLMQMIVGSSILAIPVGFTEETWNLGQSLPILNVFLIFLVSLLFIGTFVYHNFYRGNLEVHKKEFTKRIISIYLFSFIVVSILLSVIQRAPWSTDLLLALKRVVIVTFPASMSAAVADMIK